jgi:phosphatidylglycerophosphate synthase
LADITKHERVNDILLGPWERPALKWLAAHSPTWLTPDRYTAIGVAGAVLIMVSYGLSTFNPLFLWLASLGFVINWVGDSLDGTLARFRHIERPVYGFFIDHTTDAASQVMIFLGLGMSPYISYKIASLTLIAYLLLSVLVYVRTCTVGEFKISYGKLGPTEIRALAILLNIGMYFGGIRTMNVNLSILGSLTFSLYDLIVSFIALLLLYFFIVTAVKEALRLSKAKN